MNKQSLNSQEVTLLSEESNRKVRNFRPNRFYTYIFFLFFLFSFVAITVFIIYRRTQEDKLEPQALDITNKVQDENKAETNSLAKLDLTFDDDGYVLMQGTAGGNEDEAQAVRILPDGKYIAAGMSKTSSNSYDMTIWKYNTDGSLDTSFNGSGYFTHGGAAGGTADDGAYDMRIQSDGKIIAVGFSARAGGSHAMTIWRLESDGTLDETFGDGSCSNGVGAGSDMGCSIHYGTAGTSGDRAFEVKIQSDGKYILIGTGTRNSTNQDMAIWRYNSDGTLDTTFNGTGYANFDRNPGTDIHDFGYSITIQSDGKYIATGTSGGYTGVGGSNAYDMILWRYNSNGTIDTSFNTTGYITHDNAAGGNASDQGRSVQISSDGKYVIAGGSSRDTTGDYDMTIWKYNSNGTLDCTFGDGTCNNGVGAGSDMGCINHNNAASGNHQDMGEEMQIQSDGKYVVTGYSTNTYAPVWPDSVHWDMVIWRYNDNGLIDTTFGDIGYVTFNLQTVVEEYGDDVGHGIVPIHNEKYIVAGFAMDNVLYNNQMALWRYENLFQIETTMTPNVDDISIRTDTTNGKYGDITVNVEKESFLLADVEVTITQDLDWSEVYGDFSNDDFKSYIVNLSTAPGTADTFTLYVPRDNSHDAVYICPNADSLSAVSLDCSEGFSLGDGQSSQGITANQTTVNSDTVWQLDGVSGTGAISYAESTDADQNSDGTDGDSDGFDYLPQTGGQLPETNIFSNDIPIVLGIGFLSILAGILQFLLLKSYIKPKHKIEKNIGQSSDDVSLKMT